jgi:hypothetical protein
MRPGVPAEQRGFERHFARDEVTTLLDPGDVQQALKLSSRRSARGLMDREMQHIVVGRTPMTTQAWLAEWLERQRRSPRGRVACPSPSAPIEGGAGAGVRSTRAAMPAPRRRTKDA